MRLTSTEITAIKAAAHETFGDGTGVRLFGIRVHDHLRGGDIDLLLEIEPGQDTISHRPRFLSALFERIDERKVDLVLHVRGTEPAAFTQLVLHDAVPLP